jgi:hypothetical protein
MEQYVRVLRDACDLWDERGPKPQLAATGMTITLEREGVGVPG